MKRHVNVLFLIVGILLLCMAIATIMAQTFGHRPVGNAPGALSEETSLTL